MKKKRKHQIQKRMIFFRLFNSQLVSDSILSKTMNEEEYGTVCDFV